MDRWIQDTPREERLAKYLARSGVASRRSAEDLIAAGVVRVNGKIVTEMGTRVVRGRDRVELNGEVIAPIVEKTTVAIHKPTGFVATAYDPQHRPITEHLLPNELRQLRLVPVGRLDADSEGLLLLSNDGELALRLTHPRFGTTKTYHVLADNRLTSEQLDQLRQGVELPGEEERTTAPAQVRRIIADAEPGQYWFEVTLHEGRKRQVRLMFAVVQARVLRLIRVGIGQLDLAKIVPNPRDFHILTPDEIMLAQKPATPLTRDAIRRDPGHRAPPPQDLLHNDSTEVTPPPPRDGFRRDTERMGSPSPRDGFRRDPERTGPPPPRDGFRGDHERMGPPPPRDGFRRDTERTGPPPPRDGFRRDTGRMSSPRPRDGFRREPGRMGPPPARDTGYQEPERETPSRIGFRREPGRPGPPLRVSYRREPGRTEPPPRMSYRREAGRPEPPPHADGPREPDHEEQ